MKIKGLNSFIEEQVIDFEQLTARGLFGIFGPTGSGKTSILDGITLALYGDISRNSSNFINANSERASVSFEFQMTSATVKRYLVEREFHLDKKTLAPRTGKCRLVDITEEEPVILADKVTAITSQCKEIIGLTEDDFTRTVVLPQGKFSEFLKMEGKSRRDMLERLFHLQQYGEDLRKKLVAANEKEKEAYTLLMGEAKGYENITRESYEEITNEANGLYACYEKEKNSLEELHKEYEVKKELRSWMDTLANHRKEYEGLCVREEEMAVKQQQLEQGKRAAVAIPYVNAYEDTRFKQEKSQRQMEETKQTLAKLTKEKEQLEQEFQGIKQRKEEELPSLTRKEQIVREALKEKQQVEQLIQEQKTLQERLLAMEENAKKGQGMLEAALLEKKEQEEVVANLTKCLEEVQVDASYKEQIKQGEIAMLTLKTKQQVYQEVIKKEEEKQKEQQQLQEQKTQVEQQFKKTEQQEQALLKIIEELEEQSPGTQEQLLEQKEALLVAKTKWQQYETNKAKQQEVLQEIERLRFEQKEKKKEQESMKSAYEKAKRELEQIQVEQLAHTLREQLEEGQPCPVCGSIHHSIEALLIPQGQSLEEARLELEELEKKLREQERINVSITTRLEQNEQNQNELEQQLAALGTEFLKITIQEQERQYEQFTCAIATYQKQKEEQTNQLNQVREEKQKVLTQQSVLVSKEEGLRVSLEQLGNECQQKEQEVGTAKELLQKLQQVTQVFDFIKESQGIATKEQQRQNLEKQIKELRNSTKELEVKALDFQEKLNGLRLRQETVKAQIEQKGQEIGNKQKSITQRVGERIDLSDYLQEVLQEVECLMREYQKKETFRERKLAEYQEVNDCYIQLLTVVNELKERFFHEKNALEKVLNDNQFETIQQVKETSRFIEATVLLEEELKEYRDALSRCKGAIETIEKKLDHREVTEEEWTTLTSQVQHKEQLVQEQYENYIRLQEEQKRLRTGLERLADLVEKKEKLEHKMGILSDLDHLFKGKKFVEFVATERLHYISKEASKRLEEITSGNYGLETDAAGRFMIRDNKNGGALRDASTLSGGETFLTSLALALSLSAEIQLKGTAPLEFFFLDEGFGTLDDQLLEVVMSSLEKLHNDRLKVGIISHVESVKNRVPIKLIVAPAVTGEGGSKVKIEIN